jgi:hypothetical protein
LADSTNPLITVYNSLWSLLEEKSEFTDLFPSGTPHQLRYYTGNVVTDYAAELDLKDLSPADYPRCRIVVTAVLPRLNFCSDGSSVAARFRIEVCTGHQMQS